MKPSPEPPASGASQQACRLKGRIDYAFNYLLYRPRGYSAASGRRWPLLVFLHGKGESGDDLALVEKHGPPREIARGRAFPFVVVSPQCPGEWWNYVALDAFVGQVIRRYRVDRARVYLTGLSMGGFGTWALALQRPERYAAIAPICGGGEVRHSGPRLRGVPIWAFHGAKDPVVLPERSQEMVEAVRAAGGKPRFTLYPDAGHDAWTKPYRGKALYAWLLSHRQRIE